MYTECPECGIAFRVTAKVLQQAKGNVRCGGCNHAFNALEFLSEEMPGVVPAESESVSDDDLAETSRRLLKTLDELAGSSEVRIEDTGVEWRVLDENLDGDDSAEVDDAIENEASTETRYDDNSPLPDELDEIASDVEEEAAHTEESDGDRPRVEFTESDDDVALSDPDEWTDLLEEVRDPETETSAADTDDDDADHEVLAESDEVESESTDETEQDDIWEMETEAQQIEAELAALDAQLLSEAGGQDGIEEDHLADLETQLNLQAEALGLETTGVSSELIDESAPDESKLADDSSSDSVDDEPTEDDVSSEEAHDEYDAAPLEEDDVADSDEASQADDEGVDEDHEEEQEEEDDEEIEVALDGDDSEEELDSLADEDEVETEEDEEIDLDDSADTDVDDETTDEEDDEDDEYVATEETADDEVDDETTDDSEGEAAVESEGTEQDDDDASELNEEDESLVASNESTSEFEAQIEVAASALAGVEDIEDALDDDEIEVDGDDISLDFLALENQATDDAESDEQATETEEDDDEDELTGETEHFVPAPTDAEMTVNMEIDQEMMALAQQDDEFSATLVGMATPEELLKQKPEKVEAIIMEGEIVRNAVEQERLAAEEAARSQLDDASNRSDAYAVDLEKIRGGRRTDDPPAYRLMGGVIVLGLILLIQFVHNSREAFATSGFFNQTISPVYRVFGNPITPEWDIKGWQFETTNGSIGDEENSLVIVSRLSNQSETALPYPLVHVSLTDRWEEIMGSRILEPSEYLAGALDPSTNVPPGQNFTAVITIEDPAVEATGFKLNVCYRQEPGVVRCAIEDFK